MSDENTPNNDPLNNAVENPSDEASGAENAANPTYRQSQNQATTHTVASGDGTLSSTGTSDGSSAAASGDSSEAEPGEGAASSGSDSGSAGASAGDSSSNVVESSTDTDSSASDDSSGASTQSVGGSSEGDEATSTGSSAGASAESSTASGSSDDTTEPSADGGPDTQTTEETVSVEVTDEIGESFDTETTSETFSVQFSAENDTPEAGAPIELSMEEDGSFLFTQELLLVNTSDVDGDTLTALNLAVGSNAEVIANEDGTFTVTPDADFNGVLDFTFDISDGTETVSSAGVLTVNAVNDAPVVADQSFSVAEDGTLTITDAQLLSGATDVEGDVLSV